MTSAGTLDARTSTGTFDGTGLGRTDLAVHVRGLHKSYPGPRGRSTSAVAGIDLDVARGEVVALLGPNGAGKSTTTEVLEGYRHRDSGEVVVLGRDPWRAPPSWRARVGIVLQDTAAVPDLSVTELVRHFRTLFPDPRGSAEVIDLVGLSDTASRRVAALSGGQRRRLDVAVGILGRPELLFLDEPTTGFDPEARRQFWALVEQLRDEGTTVLLTTHYLDEAERLADRVAVVAGGRLVACAPPHQLGGDRRSHAVVRWRSPDGAEHETTTTEPTALVAALAATQHGGGELRDLRVSRMSLEDVYLALVGDHGTQSGIQPGTGSAVAA